MEKEYKNHPYYKTLNFISQQVKKQRDKYRDGEKQNLFQWEDFYYWFMEAYGKHLDETFEKVTKLEEGK